MTKVNMSECFKKHPMLHMLTGLGIGLVLIAIVPDLAANAMMIGIIAIVAGIGLELVLGQK